MNQKGEEKIGAKNTYQNVLILQWDIFFVNNKNYLKVK